MTFCFAFLGTGLLSWLLGWPVYQWLISRNVIDRPNERSSHDRPTVRGGGIAIMGTLFAALSCLYLNTGEPFLLGLGSVSLLLAVVSFIDDLRSVRASLRFGCHALVAAAVLWLMQISSISLKSGSMEFVLPAALMWAIFFLWITGYTNAFNFMDGINGIAGVQALTTGLGMAAITVVATGNVDLPVQVALCTAGAALGFLPHNFPKARMFMGDVSSAPLGFLLATLVILIASQQGWDLLVPLVLMHTNFVGDTAITLVRRVARGEKWYLPHREHFYQRLIRSGKTHTFVTALQGLFQVLTALLLCLSVRFSEIFRFAALAAVLLLWGGFFLYAEITFRARLGCKK